MGKGKGFMLLFLLLLLILYCPSVLAEEGKRGGTIAGSVTIITNNLLFGQRKEKANNEVIIFLDGIKEKNSVPPKNRTTISQRGKQFNPQILPIAVGTTVDFPNDDDIYHNVFSLSKAKPFDLGLYKAGDMSKSVTFDKRGLVRVYCNIHPQMIADVLVLNNPYFTFTGKDGSYTLSEVPPGKYKIRAWGRRVESIMKDVNIAEGQVIKINFELAERKFSTYHKDKYGKDYKNKY